MHKKRKCVNAAIADKKKKASHPSLLQGYQYFVHSENTNEPMK